MRVLVRNNKETSHLPFTPNHSRTRCGLEDSRGTAAPGGPRRTALICEGAWQRWSRLHPHRLSLQERSRLDHGPAPRSRRVCRVPSPFVRWAPVAWTQRLLGQHARGALTPLPALGRRGQPQLRCLLHLYFWGLRACGVSAPRPGAEPLLPPLGAWGPGRALFSPFYCENRKAQEQWVQRTARG